MKAIAVIQARMGSTRLPGKVLRKLAGHAMLWHVIQRVQAAGLEVIVATSQNPEDSALRGWLFDNKIRYYGGHPTDVLDRYYQTVDGLARMGHYHDAVVRVTGDCPLVDPDVIRRAVSTYYETPSDIVGASIGSYFDGGYPDGLDVEVFSVHALRYAWVNCMSSMSREHVTWGMWNNYNDVKTYKLKNDYLPHDNTKLSVDTEEDFTRVEAIYAEHYLRPEAIFRAAKFLKS